MGTPRGLDMHRTMEETFREDQDDLADDEGGQMTTARMIMRAMMTGGRW